MAPCFRTFKGGPGRVCFPAFTQQLATICKFTTRDLTPFSGSHMHCKNAKDRHACSQNMHIHKRKILNFKIMPFTTKAFLKCEWDF